MTLFSKLVDRWMKEPAYRAVHEANKDARAVADELVRARMRAQLTQAEVAARMGTTQPVVARLERGVSLPSLATVARYADATGSAIALRLLPATAPRTKAKTTRAKTVKPPRQAHRSAAE